MSEKPDRATFPRWKADKAPGLIVYDPNFPRWEPHTTIIPAAILTQQRVNEAMANYTPKPHVPWWVRLWCWLWYQWEHIGGRWRHRLWRWVCGR